MRIISQLVPNGKPVSTDIEATRQPGETAWEIPTWGHPLALGVYPVFVTKARRLIPAATASCISNLGVSITALGGVIDAARRHGHDEFLRQMECRPSSNAKTAIGMAIFHHHAPPGGKLSGDLWNVESIEGAPPTDVGYLFPQFLGGSPYLPLPISFGVPLIGSRVICVGFSDPEISDGALSLDDIQSGRTKLLDVYEHKLLAVEGHVNRIFTKSFADGSVGGPCFTIDAEIKRDMAGGPVFSENGYICGVISAPATDYFGGPTSIVSLLYPTLMMSIRFGGQLGTVRISSKRPLVELIAQGAIITDGSEKLVAMREEGGEFFLYPPIQGEDVEGIYDDLPSFREGRHSARKSIDAFRFSDKCHKKNGQPS